MEGNPLTLSDFEDLRKNVGFHFTSKQNLESILETGLTPRIGANASGALGQSAIPKTYISYGLEGVLQLYNRLLNLSLQGHLADFQGNKHKPFLPDSVRNNDPSYRLNILEGFEFIRQYMENNVYLMFDAPMSQYDHKLSDVELIQLNAEISLLKDEQGDNIVEKVDKLNDEITRLSNDRTQDHRETIEKYVAERNKLAIDVWKKTLTTVQGKQGNLQNGDQTLILDTIDFNDERLRWTNFEENPHNTHTRMIEEDGKVHGVPISPDALHVFSVDGIQRADGVQFLKEIYKEVTDADLTHIEVATCVDVDLLNYFNKYVELVEKYKEQGILVTRPKQTIDEGDKSVQYDSTLVVDLSNIANYPGLEAFEQEAKAYYETEKQNCKTARLALKEAENKKLAQVLARTSAQNQEVALLQDKAGLAVSELEKSPERVNDSMIREEN